MDYVFELSPIEGDALLPQLSRVLQARTELVSRSKHPGMWRASDRMNREKLTPEAAARSRTLRFRIWGVLLLVLGALLLIPALGQGKLLAMLASVLSILAGIQNLRWASGKGFRAPDFDTPARQLLAGLAAPGRRGGRVSFAGPGIELRPSEGESMAVPYEDVDYLFETEELIVFTDRVRIIVLRKAELSGGDVDGWRRMIVKKTDNYIDLRA